MISKQVFFKNRTGLSLSGKLELPVGTKLKGTALFAHCFTCNKNLHAPRNIAKALTNNGFAVLRFDFTGLGESEGDFAENEFSTNVSDLVDAANYLASEFKAPTL